jgi:uncharacterized protein (TIGR03437 family)
MSPKLPAAVFLDGKLAGDPAIGSGFRNAVSGELVQLFVTGLLPVPASTLITRTTVSGVSVTIGSVTIPIPASDVVLVAVGEFQVNFTVPQLSSDLYSISISINGVSSPASINTSPPGPVVFPIH